MKIASVLAVLAVSPKEEAVSYARQMILAHPGSASLDIDVDVLSRCIDDCLNCAQACTACADACVSEETVAHLRRCIYLCINCADICDTTGRIVSHTAEFDRALARTTLEACALSCDVCGAECEIHAKMGMVHCEICAEACRRCEEACRALIAVL